MKVGQGEGVGSLFRPMNGLAIIDRLLPKKTPDPFWHPLPTPFGILWASPTSRDLFDDVRSRDGAKCLIKPPKFRLATALLLIALIAMALGWWQDWHRRQSPLYLHILRPKTYVGEKTSPPQCVASILVPSHGQFDAEFQEHSRSLSGTVTSQLTGGYQLEFNAGFMSGFSHSGPVELDTITSPNGVFFFSGVINLYAFALSRDKNGQSLLDKSNKSLSERQALYEE